MKVKKSSKPSPRKKIVILLVSLVLLSIGFCLLYINKQDNQKIITKQENYKQEEVDQKEKEEVRKELAKLMTREVEDEEKKVKILLEGVEFSYIDKKVEKEIQEKLVYMLNTVCEIDELREFHKKIDITFMITSNIARLAREKNFPIPKAVGIAGSDSFYFVGRKPKGQIEQFIILDKTVFDADMKLLVVLMHESIHARNFVMGIAKKDFFDEEVQACEQTIKSLEDFYDKTNLEKQYPETAEELKRLIVKEKITLTMFKHNKNLKDL